MNTLFGMKVIQTHVPLREPVLKLQPDVPVSERFRAEMNAWLLDQFGTREVAYIFNPGALKSMERRINGELEALAFGFGNQPAFVGSTLTIDALRKACKLVSEPFSERGEQV